jgi:hypothetical protein
LRRREFIKVIGGAATWPLAAHAQQAVGMRHIGILLYAKEERVIISPVLSALESLGYVDGKTVSIEYRDAGGLYERLQEAANEIAGLKPDVIFSFGGEQAPFVKNATNTIPVVVVVSNDPVASGLVASLGRPGGNITGLTYVHDMLAGMYTTCWLESQSNSLRRRRLRYPVLPSYGIPIMSIPSIEKLSALRALWASNSNRSRCGSPAILMEHSRLHRARVRRPLSFLALGLYFETGSESGILSKRTSSSSLECRAG